MILKVIIVAAIIEEKKLELLFFSHIATRHDNTTWLSLLNVIYYFHFKKVVTFILLFLF